MSANNSQPIDNPQAAKFCNENIRVAADKLSQRPD
jgi:hypothetical protein